MSADALLVLRCFGPHLGFARFLDAARPAIAREGGRIEAARPVHEVQAIEPGSVPGHVLIARFADPGARDAAWAMLSPLLAETGAGDGPEPVVLALAAVPHEGLGPDIPTAASVPVAPSLAPPTLLIIEGSASDQAQMDRYRDIILPMMAERSAYYTAFELGGSVQVLAGQWSEAIFAISQWPSAGHALDFWLSHRYQSDAIPLRLDIGRFAVLALEGERA